MATGESGASLSEIKLGPGEGIAGWVAKTGKPALVNDVDSDDRHAVKVDISSGYTTQSLVAVPMVYEDSVIGVLEAVNKRYGEFEQSDLTALSAFAGLASVAIANARKFERLTSQNQQLKEQAFGKWELIGKSHAIAKLRDLIQRVAPTPTTVLITGESGTGKEVVAHQIHQLSPRENGPFVKVSCAALPETLLESELFGHERGAFTGANDRRIGRFEAAAGGTILLDEIGEITHSVQTKLLRILQEKEFERLGSGKTMTTDARLIAATNRDLKKSVESGEFREDLYYRLNVLPINVPPLREHPDDIPLLIEYFLSELSEQFPHKIRAVEDDVMDVLMSYSWPGNVRELFNLIERCAVISRSERITMELIPPEIKGTTTSGEMSGAGLDLTLPQAEEMLIRRALKLTGGNVSKTSRKLDISRDRLRYRLKKYNINPKEYR
ncbi:hypothetical protein DRQ36_09470 [bacterium]|nr:MAG: hypothetical protein DRQ36_09470 [bacterium]